MGISGQSFILLLTRVFGGMAKNIIVMERSSNMILRITVNDNDFTEYLEQFAQEPTIPRFFYTTKDPEYSNIEAFKQHERLYELFYNTEKYTPELVDELIARIKKCWELWVRHMLILEDWQDTDTQEYLIKNFEVKFQKSLAPKWENGEVVYICLGYHGRWWTF
jgi:hypothetical protein